VSWAINPTTREWRRRRLWATRFGRKPRLSIAATTAARRASLTGILGLRTFETVPIDTPARRATSLIVALDLSLKRLAFVMVPFYIFLNVSIEGKNCSDEGRHADNR
jgi:hypothetical protein